MSAELMVLKLKYPDVPEYDLPFVLQVINDLGAGLPVKIRRYTSKCDLEIIYDFGGFQRYTHRPDDRIYAVWFSSYYCTYNEAINMFKKLQTNVGSGSLLTYKKYNVN